ncbi:MAG: PAS domain-containing protein [Alphaproteobacteria bacterium]
MANDVAEEQKLRVTALESSAMPSAGKAAYCGPCASPDDILAIAPGRWTDEKALRDSEAYLRAIVENSPWCISVKDTEGRYLVINDAYARWLNTDGAQIVGKTGSEVENLRDADKIRAHDNEVIQQRRAITYERDAQRHDGARQIWSVSKFPAMDRDGKLFGVATIGIDITAHRELETSLRQAQKMESVGQLTGGIAHDFNNILGIIIGNLDHLSEALAEDSDLHGLIEPAVRAALSGAALNRQLLSFSSKQALMPEVLNLNDGVSAMLGMLDRTLGNAVEIEAKPDDGLWLTYVDPHHLESALLNLAINARDAMPAGGKLTVETSNLRHDGAGTAAPADLRPGEYVVMTITDTGTGMAPDVLEHAFEPFFTTKPVGQGSGLGLSMVFGFANQSGGHAAIVSAADQGTTVRLYLPRATRLDAPVEKDRGEGPQIGSGTVLVVEDDLNYRDVVARLLRDLGYRVLTAHDGVSGLEKIAQAAPVDIVLVDVVLPGGMSGPEFAAEAARRQPDIRIVYMSGYPRAAAAQRSGLHNGATILEKPFQKAEFVAGLRSVLGDGPAPVA